VYSGKVNKMKLKEIEREAIALPEKDRADLVCKLLDTLPAFDSDVSDEEILTRDRELDSGAVQPMSLAEFERKVREERGQ
jgi:hypothetical protein